MSYACMHSFHFILLDIEFFIIIFFPISIVQRIKYLLNGLKEFLHDNNIFYYSLIGGFPPLNFEY